MNEQTPNPPSWRVVIEESHASFGTYSLVYRGCPGLSAVDAIDYALEVLGERVPEACPLAAWAALEDDCSDPVRLTRRRIPHYRRQT